MSLTKKQKKFIIDNYRNRSIEEIARSLSLSSSEVNKYLEARGLSVQKHKIKKSESFELKEFHLILILIFIALIAGIICFDKRLYISGDNAIYMDLGKSIARGKWMGHQTQYPFGFPLMLAIVQIISNNSLLAQKILIFLFYIGSIPILFYIFRGYIGNKWGFILSLITVLSTYLIEFSHYVMT
ncbi:hypothetical protein DRQ09_04280, partial [candidate division KSB1 bacterium]